MHPWEWVVFGYYKWEISGSAIKICQLSITNSAVHFSLAPLAFSTTPNYIHGWTKTKLCFCSNLLWYFECVCLPVSWLTFKRSAQRRKSFQSIQWQPKPFFNFNNYWVGFIIFSSSFFNITHTPIHSALQSSQWVHLWAFVCWGAKIVIISRKEFQFYQHLWPAIFHEAYPTIDYTLKFHIGLHDKLLLDNSNMFCSLVRLKCVLSILKCFFLIELIWKWGCSSYFCIYFFVFWIHHSFCAIHSIT